MSDDRARALLRQALEEVYVGRQEIEADAVADKLEDLGVALTAPSKLLVPPDDLVMICDGRNVAHVLKPEAERTMLSPTLCGAEATTWAALHGMLDMLAKPWSLLTNKQYRAWPPWACQSCLGAAPEQLSLLDPT